jgi:HD superfamily phosphohydrolase
MRRIFQGHGPFSHVFDHQFMPRAKPGSTWHHEEASTMMLDSLIESNGIDIEPEAQRFLHELINPTDNAPSRRSDGRRFLFDVVANSRNSVDVDKFDYLQRDCMNVGMKSSYDPERLVKFSRVIDDEICFPAKEAFNLYELFHTRYSLFKQVCCVFSFVSASFAIQA